ncbi:MAG: hypothetical protein JW927_05780 [Deltaproteobacteria bacterium]|nr:hypothetical protein [Deltaproteobacteria bacterium]
MGITQRCIKNLDAQGIYQWDEIDPAKKDFQDYITGKGRHADRVKARDRMCYWCNNKIGISMAELSRRLDITMAAVSYAVSRGEKVAKEGKYTMEI